MHWSERQVFADFAMARGTSRVQSTAGPRKYFNISRAVNSNRFQEVVLVPGTRKGMIFNVRNPPLGVRAAERVYRGEVLFRRASHWTSYRFLHVGQRVDADTSP